MNIRHANSDETIIYLIDFDSTFTKVEALDELANIVLKDDPNKKSIENKIHALTDLAMEGELSFDEALKQRLTLIAIHQTDIEALIDVLKTKVSDSFLRNQLFLTENAHRIYIISGGFKEFILPVVIPYGIDESHVFANDFLLNEQGIVIGFNETNYLSQAKGKVKLVESLQLQGKVIVIGDGYTDYEIKEAGYAQVFYLFTENIVRENLILKADHVATCLEDIILN